MFFWYYKNIKKVLKLAENYDNVKRIRDCFMGVDG